MEERKPKLTQTLKKKRRNSRRSLRKRGSRPPNDTRNPQRGIRDASAT